MAYISHFRFLLIWHVQHGKLCPRTHAESKTDVGCIFVLASGITVARKERTAHVKHEQLNALAQKCYLSLLLTCHCPGLVSDNTSLPEGRGVSSIDFAVNLCRALVIRSNIHRVILFSVRGHPVQHLGV